MPETASHADKLRNIARKRREAAWNGVKRRETAWNGVKRRETVWPAVFSSAEGGCSLRRLPSLKRRCCNGWWNTTLSSRSSPTTAGRPNLVTRRHSDTARSVPTRSRWQRRNWLLLIDVFCSNLASYLLSVEGLTKQSLSLNCLTLVIRYVASWDYIEIWHPLRFHFNWWFVLTTFNDSSEIYLWIWDSWLIRSLNCYLFIRNLWDIYWYIVVIFYYYKYG